MGTGGASKIQDRNFQIEEQKKRFKQMEDRQKELDSKFEALRANVVNWSIEKLIQFAQDNLNVEFQSEFSTDWEAIEFAYEEMITDPNYKAPNE